MPLIDVFRPATQSHTTPMASGGQYVELGDLTDPRLADFLRNGAETQSGAIVTDQGALRNPAVFRAVNLISTSMAMMSMQIHRRTDSVVTIPVTDHPIHDILQHEPSRSMSPATFKTVMQANTLIKGNGYAYKMTNARGEISALEVLPPGTVTPKRLDDFSIRYTYRPATGGGRDNLPPDRVMHLKGLTGEDGVIGISPLLAAREAIGISMIAEKRSGRRVGQGIGAGGFIKHPGSLSTERVAMLRDDFNATASGAENVGRWTVLEEGMEVQKGFSAEDDEELATRKFEVEEISRSFGIPRPLLMVDETSWGSGIEQLAIMYIRFCLAPWFDFWGDALALTCLTRAERRLYCFKFDEKALLRGLMKDQGEYFAKALGSGGHPAWMEANEVRANSNLPPLPEGSGLSPGTAKGANNDPAKTT